MSEERVSAEELGEISVRPPAEVLRVNISRRDLEAAIARVNEPVIDRFAQGVVVTTDDHVFVNRVYRGKLVKLIPETQEVHTRKGVFNELLCTRVLWVAHHPLPVRR